MGQAIIDGMIACGDAVLVDAGSIGDFLRAVPDRASALFFTGDPDKKLETADLAVVLREVKRGAGGALRLAVVDRKDEKALMSNYRVGTLPSVVFYAGERHLETIPKVQNWSVYEEKIPAILARAADGRGEEELAHG